MSADLAPRGEEGRYSGYMNTALLGGIAGGPVLGGVLRDLSSMSVNFLTMSVMSGVSFLLLAVLLPSVESIRTGPKKPPAGLRHTLAITLLPSGRRGWRVFVSPMRVRMR